MAGPLIELKERLEDDAMAGGVPMAVALVEEEAIGLGGLRAVESGAEVDEGTAGLSDAGQSVMDVWSKMDDGTIADQSAGFDEADRTVRERHAAPEG